MTELAGIAALAAGVLLVLRAVVLVVGGRRASYHGDELVTSVLGLALILLGRALVG